MQRLLTICAALWLLICSTASQSADREVQRQQYLQALSTLKAGDRQRFQSMADGLSDYPLYPYLIAAGLADDIEHVKVQPVRQFLQSHPGLPAATDLRQTWLRNLAKQDRWQDYLADYRPQRSITLRCHALNARLARGLAVALDASSQDLWLFGDSRPGACDPVFAHWRKTGQLDQNLFWRRGVLAVSAGDLQLAGWLASTLDASRREELERWIALRRSPEAQLARAKNWSDSAINRRMISEEILRLTASDPEAANRFWLDLKTHFSFDAGQQLSVPRRIALMRATDYPADALDGLAALPAGARDLQILEWSVRVALHAGQWDQVLITLDQLPKADQRRDRWRYWRARALEQLGKTGAAREIFTELASGAHYHGFLAAERLGLPYTLCPKLRSVDLIELEPVTENAAFERSIELFHVGQLATARREFNLASAKMSPEQRRVAAALADAEGWHAQAILTLADAGFLRHYSMRFPLAFGDRVTREAARRKLNPSLVFAVMRSESAMAIDAVSGAGARGLMQLTPDTAREVARRYQLPARGSLLKADRNISLGSAYLDQLFGEFGHPLKVLAAYNAGPEPVLRWQSMGMPLEADRWIETVPYHETRDYLARVLAFATIYDWRRLGRMVPLSVRMPPLDQAPGKTDLNARPSVRSVCALTAGSARVTARVAARGSAKESP
jgi:soluble lytic murein transglycosylase